MEKAAAKAMVKNAGFIEGTQLSKLGDIKVNANNSSGIRGVSLNRRTGKWRAAIVFKGEYHYLGDFTNIEDAIKARHHAEELYFAPLLKKYHL